MTPERDYDVIVLGAGGGAGARTAQYLSKVAPETGTRWAAAGRSEAAIRRRLTELDVAPPAVFEVDVQARDGALDALAGRTRVVLNAVGRYTECGMDVVSACVRKGAHYADLSGEIAHVRRVIERWHTEAEEARVQVVQVCGFETVPMDVAVWLAAERARSTGIGALVDVELIARVSPPKGRQRVSDWLAKGTRDSMLAVCRGEDPSVIAESGALVDDPDRHAEVQRCSPITLRPRRDREGLIAAMPPAFVNPAVIQRTAALLAAEAETTTEPFRYREGVRVRRAATAWAIAAPLAGMREAARRRLMRLAGAWALEQGFRCLPGGPDDARLEGWSWTMTVRALTTDRHLVTVEVMGDGHPGYGSTTRIFAEAGLMLAGAGDRGEPWRAGCLTPALAFGSRAQNRLQRAGVTFAVSTQEAADLL